ncbi:hypothetical protein PIB30_093900 [Stylosanthes scabra]|uniref:Uncharacterized protein n=1 Tax=Stylosanthes scabra TaxID=79078 RepID=A0ABU6QW17_9FABA|nr:hypothetical protein [Stylosanthes scabra]
MDGDDVNKNSGNGSSINSDDNRRLDGGNNKQPPSSRSPSFSLWIQALIPSTPSDALAAPIPAHPAPAVLDSASIDHVSALTSPVSAPVTDPISTRVGKKGPLRGIAKKMLKTSATGKLRLPASLERFAPNGIHAELFASEVGIVTRQNAPLDVEKWSLVGDDVKQKIYDIVLAKFDKEDPAAIRQMILAKTNVAYRSWRSRLREHYELSILMKSAFKIYRRIFFQRHGR